MTNPGSNTPVLAEGGQAIKMFLLQIAGARPRICAYCASMIPVGVTRCTGCGANVTSASPEIEKQTPTKQQWILPLLVCILFPPALFFVIPYLLWQRKRRPGLGWIIAILVSIFFLPIALLLAPVLIIIPFLSLSMFF